MRRDETVATAGRRKWTTVARGAIGPSLGPSLGGVLGVVLGAVLGAAAAVAGPIAADCPLGQPVVRDIVAEGFYTDAAHSVPDPAALARNRAALVPLDGVVGAITQRANRFYARARADEAGCALALIARQATGGAMLGRMSSQQAGYERKWRAAGLAMVYLALKDEADGGQRAAIEPWLKRLADAVEVSDARPANWNNHHYWIGFVATTVAVATGDPARLARGRKIFDDGLAAIDADGALPREMGRKARALHYHAFATAPLVMAAEVAARAGEDWYGRRDGALHRLVARVAAGIADPSWFEARAGVTVEPPGGGTLAWIAFYDRRFPGRITPTPRPHRANGLGGDLDALAARWLPDAAASGVAAPEATAPGGGAPGAAAPGGTAEDGARPGAVAPGMGALEAE
jgi:poly(beta-D-mannuronate) lyase